MVKKERASGCQAVGIKKRIAGKFAVKVWEFGLKIKVKDKIIKCTIITVYNNVRIKCMEKSLTRIFKECL